MPKGPLMNKTTLTAIAMTAFALTLGANVSFADTPSASSTTAGIAQPGHKHGDGHLMKELGLTKDQLAQIKTIRNDIKPKVEAIKNDTTLSEADKKAKLKELRKATRTQIEAVLTPEQRDKLKQLREARKDQHQAAN